MSSVVVEEKVETPEEAKQYSNINEAPQVKSEEPQTEPELPSKFQGKSVTEIVSSYENLEKELGRKGQEIGELRQLTDQILKQQVTTQTGTAETKEEEEEVDFFDDPDRAVSKAIENHPKFREFEEQQKVQSAQATTRQLETAHPDYLEVVADTKFQEWVKSSPIRTQLYVNAHNYDLNSAMELMGNWKERSLITNTAEAEKTKALRRSEALKAGKAVSGGSADSTADLIRLKSTDPRRYEDLQDEILSAYSEGRVK